jgi:hypothetical protein
VDVADSTIKIGWSKWSCSVPATCQFMLREAGPSKHQVRDTGHNCSKLNVLCEQPCKWNIGVLFPWLWNVLNTLEPRFYVPQFTFTLHLQHFFRSLQFSYIHKALFTSVLRFQNFKFSSIYIFRALNRENSFDIKWCPLIETSVIYIFGAHTEGTVLI